MGRHLTIAPPAQWSVRAASITGAAFALHDPGVIRFICEAAPGNDPQDILGTMTEIIETVEPEAAQRDLYETIRLAMDQRVRDEIARKGLARSHITILDALL